MSNLLKTRTISVIRSTPDGKVETISVPDTDPARGSAAAGRTLPTGRWSKATGRWSKATGRWSKATGRWSKATC